MSKYLDNDIQKKKSPKRLRLPAEPFRAALGNGWRITLGIGGKYASQQGKILKVEDDGIVVKTDEWLDISEVYSIKGVDA